MCLNVGLGTQALRDGKKSGFARADQIKCYGYVTLKSFQDTLLKDFKRLVKMSDFLAIGNTNYI